MPKGKGIVGHALYFELRRLDATQQMFFSQSLYAPATNEVIPVRMLARVLTAKNPRRKWRAKRVPLAGVIANSGTRSLTEVASIEGARQTVAPLLTAIAYELSLVMDTGWDLVGEPVVIEMTETDLEATRVGKAPEALIRRINTARIDSGYPKNLIQTGAGESIDSEDLALAY